MIHGNVQGGGVDSLVLLVQNDRGVFKGCCATGPEILVLVETGLHRLTTVETVALNGKQLCGGALGVGAAVEFLLQLRGHRCSDKRPNDLVRGHDDIWVCWAQLERARRKQSFLT